VRAVGGHDLNRHGRLFTFFLLIGAQVSCHVFGRRTAQWLALLVQAGFVVALLQALLFVPALAPLVRAAFAGADRTMVAYLPPTWFLALYQTLAGAPRSVPIAYGLAAVVGTAVIVLTGTMFLACSYRRLVRITLETPDAANRRVSLP
jgi:hypothetical protein